MSVGPTSVEQIINEALGRIGYPERIGNIYEGTEQARLALEFYGQTRDALLREGDWDFSQRTITAAISGSAPVAPWTNAYDYPDDCIRVRGLFGDVYIADTHNPIPTNYTIASTGTNKVIYANLANANLVYTAQVTDMTQWEPLFTEALIAALGRRLAPALRSLEELKAEAQDEKVAIEIGTGVDG